MSRKVKQAEAKMREQLFAFLEPLAKKHGLLAALQPEVDPREQEAALDALRSLVTFKELMAAPMMDGSPPGSPYHWAYWSTIAGLFWIMRYEGWTLKKAVRSAAEAMFKTKDQRAAYMATVAPVAYWLELAPDAEWAWDQLRAIDRAIAFHPAAHFTAEQTAALVGAPAGSA